MRTVRRPILFLALAVLVAACGSPAASAGPATSATPALDEGIAELIAGAEASLATGTVRVAQTIEFEGSTIIPDGTSAWAQGQATLGQPRRMHLTADFSALQLGKLEMFVDDALVYMKGPVFDQLAGEGNWLLVDIESSDPAAAPFKSLASGQNDVGMALVYLYGATEPVVATASNPIDGQIMRHLETEIDLEAARDRVPADQAEALEDLIASMRVAGIDRKLDAEVWIGGVDGLVHRMAFSYALGEGQGGGTTSTTIDFSDYGGELELNLPDDSEVVPIEEANPGQDA